MMFGNPARAAGDRLAVRWFARPSVRPQGCSMLAHNVTERRSGSSEHNSPTALTLAPEPPVSACPAHSACHNGAMEVPVFLPLAEP